MVIRITMTLIQAMLVKCMFKFTTVYVTSSYCTQFLLQCPSTTLLTIITYFIHIYTHMYACMYVCMYNILYAQR